MFLKKLCSGLLCLACFAPGRAHAEPDFSALQAQIAQLTQTVQSLSLKVDEQAREIATLKGVQTPAERLPAMSSAPASSGSRPAQGRWNPDIGVIGDVVFKNDTPKEDAEGADRVSVRELEIVFGSAVDPHTRFDATLGIADFEEMSIDEAYATRYDLPLGLTARVGRFLPRIGKSIPLHLDSLDTVDHPMVIEKYFGHHGFNKTGVDVTRPIDLPWAMTHQATFGVLEGGNGEEGTLFGETRRRPTVYSNLKNYIDLNDVTGLEIGLSHLAGARDEGSAFEVQVLGLDGTVIYRYADRRHIKLQGEAYAVSRSGSEYTLEDEDTGEFSIQDLDDARHLWGGYAKIDWRFHPQWGAGFRFDDVQLIETSEDFANPNSTERGYTGYLTFYQSEFARWRVQFSHVDTTADVDDNRVFVQGTFAIGEHKHKIT